MNSLTDTADQVADMLDEAYYRGGRPQFHGKTPRSKSTSFTPLARMTELLERDEDAGRWILAQKDKNSFAQSLYEQSVIKGYVLSEKQIAAAKRGYDKDMRQETVSTLPETFFKGILDLMEGARAGKGKKEGLKFPAIRFGGMKIYYSTRRPNDPDLAVYRTEGEVGFLGKITTPDGKFQPYIWRNGKIPATQADLDKLAKLEGNPEEQLAAEGKRLGICMICNAELSNPESVERGIGPICAGRFFG